MAIKHQLYPFQFHRLNRAEVVAVSVTGDYTYLTQDNLNRLIEAPDELPMEVLAEMHAKYFLGREGNHGSRRLLASRLVTKQETVTGGPTLHILVPTLQCAHTCRYCQVSRSLQDTGFSMTPAQVDAACDTIFESPSNTLTVEFQGGDPLLRYDLIQRAIERIARRNAVEKRSIRFVVASTLHQLSPEMCAYFKAHNVYLSTSIDGPAELHNLNRPLASRDAYERTVEGIELARECIGKDAVSALMTTTRASLAMPEAIVDEYIKLGFNEIFIRPLSPYGFAARNEQKQTYSLGEFSTFYQRALQRVLYWNKRQQPIREAAAAIALNKILSPFDAGYVDLQSPTGAGLAVLVYNYDGYVYPSDEARMLAEMGDTSLRLGMIGKPLIDLHQSPVMHALVNASLPTRTPGCLDCAFSRYCGPDPVGAYRQFRTMTPPVQQTKHCQQQTWLFDYLFRALQDADEAFLAMAHRWARSDLKEEAA